MANEDVSTWIKVVIGVVGFAILVGSTVGGVAWALSKDSTIHDSIVASHESRITANSSDIKKVEINQHLAELARTKMDGKLDLMVQAQLAMDRKQENMNQKQDKFIEYLMQYDYDKKKDTE